MGTLNNGLLDGARRIEPGVRGLGINGGIAGAPLGMRLRGATKAGAPAVGSWKAGDQVSDRSGAIWICTVTGSPGTWVAVGASAGVAPSGDTTGATDVTNLQAALSAATTAGGGVVKGQAGGTYWINATLVIGTGTTLDMTGCTVLLVNGTASATMLTDTAHNAGTLTVPSPVMDITIKGGVWDRQNNSGPNINTGGAGLGRHMFILGGQGLRIRDMNIQGTGAVGGAKYAFLIQNATNFWLEDLRGYLYISDFIHLDGPCGFGVIRNIYTTGNKDDTIGISPTDWPGNLFGNEGDITDIVIENIFSDQQEVASIVALYSGKNGSTVLNTSRIKIRNVHGYVWASAFYPIFIGDTSLAPAQGGNIDDILIDGLDCTVGASTQSLVSINSIDPGPSTGVGSVTVRNVRVRSDLTAVVNNYAPLANLVIDGVTGTTAANPFQGGLVNQHGALATIGTLTLQNVAVTSAGTQGGSLISSATSGQALTEAFLDNVWCSNVQYLASLITSPTKLNLSNVHVLGNSQLVNASSGASVAVATTGTCTFAVPTSTGSGTVGSFGNQALVADLGTTGYALANGTGVMTGMSWTAPSDGRMHRVDCNAKLYTSSALTGGAVKLEMTTSQGPVVQAVLFAGGTGTGAGVSAAQFLLEPGQTVTVQQTSAMTAGAATVWAQIWGS